MPGGRRAARRCGPPRRGRARASSALRDDADQVGERRVAQGAAALELGAQEAVGVVAGGGGDRGRVGRVGLDEHAAAARAAAGAAGELGDQRERALLGAEVREAQRRVGVEHDAERDVREVVALGHHLRAEQQPGGRGVEAGEQLGDGVLVGRGVGVEAEDRHVERAPQLGLDALGARAVAGDRQRAAGVAAARDALAVAAVVAGERVLGAVQDQRDVAVRALPRLPARAAGEEVRPPAPVEQHDRLARWRRARAASRGAASACAPRMSSTRTGGRSRAAGRRASGSRRRFMRVDGLRARRGGAGQQPRAGLVGAEGGDVAGVVARVALLLVGGVVLLVDDDQPEALDRGEDRRARADGDPRLARAQAPPLVVALALATARSAAARRCRRSGPRSARRSAASARSPARARSRPRRAPAPPRPRAGRPRSCPSR